MSECTAEDFKNARFAEHEYGPKAVRWGVNYRTPWHTAIGDMFSDEQMAEHGWRPIVEVEDPDAVVALIGRQATRIRELEGERAPLTLDTLREAWENAEVPTEGNPIREGDEVVRAIDLRARGAFEVSIAESWLTGVWSGREGSGLRVRVLRRAPQPEPWQDLAEAIEHYGWEVDSDDPKALARHLHERGVRVTGSDEA